ncbi:hypothetical protein ALC56_09412 [Trachymyrmex septentrionalis]|uniref:Uncharacterized protein n=1 Tax=Trachymyrmex septentrionalis TaxID=34720 RepID=A0A195F7U1_9HYME|nr:hypothetical protein ALC56_09412 [Trachymyrmex septentrionalis]
MPCTGCPMRLSPLESSFKFACPSNSPRLFICMPPIPQGPQWKPCCIRKYGVPCKAHTYARRLLRFNYNDLMAQY